MEILPSAGPIWLLFMIHRKDAVIVSKIVNWIIVLTHCVTVLTSDPGTKANELLRPHEPSHLGYFSTWVFVLIDNVAGGTSWATL